MLVGAVIDAQSIRGQMQIKHFRRPSARRAIPSLPVFPALVWCM